MTLELRCADVGFDCDFEAHAETEDELLEKAAAHGAKAHDIQEMDEETLAKVKAQIHEV